MELISEERSFGGRQLVVAHESSACNCTMRVGVFLPSRAAHETLPVLTWLSGLTCTEQNFITKSGVQRLAEELGLIIVAPDTSPRGDGVPDDPDGAYDFGLGAGFYLDASELPWSTNYSMYSYVTRDLPAFIAKNFPADMERQGIFGHSMGGHGALTVHLKNPDTYKSVSAFAPIVAPSVVPWGQKALRAYLGDDTTAWQAYDACKLIAARPSAASILIDQGAADDFLEEQLRPELFREACAEHGQSLNLRMQPGYSHSFYFIASFIDEHLRHHAAVLTE